MGTGTLCKHLSEVFSPSASPRPLKPVRSKRSQVRNAQQNPQKCSPGLKHVLNQPGRAVTRFSRSSHGCKPGSNRSVLTPRCKINPEPGPRQELPRSAQSWCFLSSSNTAKKTQQRKDSHVMLYKKKGGFAKLIRAPRVWDRSGGRESLSCGYLRGGDADLWGENTERRDATLCSH